MSEDNFFIGWKGNTSKEQKKWMKRILIPIFMAIPIILFVMVILANPFGHGQFELGDVKEFTGIYYEEPFPVLILDQGQLENGKAASALLVGYGKNGAKTFMQMAEEEYGNLSGKRIKIQGTRIYRDQRTLIELTKKKDSVVEVLEDHDKKKQEPRFTNRRLRGEIIDPKCWFGVMKPAEGKVHKSCAIRCISGGIPPVLLVRDSGRNSYFILKGMQGEDINKEVLEFVGEKVEVKGQSFLKNGWEVLNINPSTITYMN